MNRWPLLGWAFMLDVTRVNSQTIYALNHKLDPRKIDSFSFGFKLAMALMTPNVLRRKEQKMLQLKIKENISHFLSHYAVFPNVAEGTKVFVAGL